jgi:hypothetical protein
MRIITSSTLRTLCRDHDAELLAVRLRDLEQAAYRRQLLDEAEP